MILPHAYIGNIPDEKGFKWPTRIYPRYILINVRCDPLVCTVDISKVKAVVVMAIIFNCIFMMKNSHDQAIT